MKLLKINPYYLKPGSLLTRYRIADNYLRFYYKFLNKPIDADIQSGRYQDSPSQAINLNTYSKWLGYAFERKLEYFPNKQKKTLQKILITASDVSEEVKKRHYFDRIISLGDLFNI